ncbi:MAG: T9SS type A sorting domain-containing protein [Bacteroidia bacterium]|nr:T9SS type A sorting domain-containing protein [Bacteroidia bacterium]
MTLRFYIFFYILYIVVNIQLFSQGLHNNGAHIVFSGPAFMYIDGASGNFSNTANGLVTPSQTSTILVRGNWINNGTPATNYVFTADGGTVILDGALTNQSIMGTNPTAFTHLQLIGTNNAQLAVNNVTVGGATSFTGSLHIDNRPLFLNSNMLHHTNGAGASITTNLSGRLVSETNLAVNPSILRWYVRTTTGMHEVPFGTAAGDRIPLGFNITTPMTNAAGYMDFSTRATAGTDNQPWAGASNVAAVSFMFCPNVSLTGNPCAQNSVVDRWWDITNSHAVTADITFRYRGAENTIAGAPGNLGAQYWNGSQWLPNNSNFAITAAGVTTGTGAVTATGISNFCPFVLSSVSAPLPIEFLDFKMECSNDMNKVLHWSTISDSPISHFDILASNDGQNFQKIGTVPAASNQKQVNHYQYLLKDENKNFRYYRIMIYDFNNQAKKSKTIDAPASCNSKDFNVYYNPSLGIVINIISDGNEKISLNLFDVSGKLINVKENETIKGYQQIIWTPDVQEGIYLLNVTYGNTSKYLKIPYRHQ